MKEKEEEKSIEIDFDGIETADSGLSLSRGPLWTDCRDKNKVLFTSFPVEPTLGVFPRKASEPKGTLHVYDFKEHKKDTIVSGIDSFRPFAGQ